MNWKAKLLMMAMCAGPAAGAELRADRCFRDWCAFSDPDPPRVCYVVTSPQSSEAFKGGRDVSREVQRSPVRLYYMITPGSDVSDGLVFYAGYPIDPDIPAEAEANGRKFELSINRDGAIADPALEEYAYPSPDSDQLIESAMRAGDVMELTALSQRGTKTVDHFSLMGFSAAFQHATELCK